MILSDGFFSVLSEDVTDGGTYTFRVVFNPKHFIYQAHFPGEPITPGVCILQTALELAERVLEKRLSVTAVKNIKFLRTIVPEEGLEVVFELRIEEREEGAAVQAVVKGEGGACAKLSFTCVNESFSTIGERTPQTPCVAKAPYTCVNESFSTIGEQKRILRERGICVIIPTYNNAGTIVDVVTRAKAQCDDIIVVCDGCTDNTLSLLDALDDKPVIVKLKTNGGKGAALKAGIGYALSAGFSYAITLDADGQHFPEDIPLFLRANQRNPGMLIIGERQNLDKAERSGASRFANAFANFWFALQTLHYVKDTQSGFRLYPIKKLRGLSLLTSRYEAELELLVLSRWFGIELAGIPVRVWYPAPENRISHFEPVRDFSRIFALNTLLCILAVVFGIPMMGGRRLLRFFRTLLMIVAYASYTLFVVTPFSLIYLGIGKKTEQKKEKLHRMMRNIASFACRRIPGVPYTESNPYGETFEKPSVILCNHQSHLDLVPMLALSDKLVALTTGWVWQDPFYGYLIRNIDFLPVSMGMDSMLPKVKSLVERGYSIAIYPEGTRSQTGELGRFHKGAFHIAGELGLDIVPVVLYGSGKALPKHGRLLRKWPLYQEVGKRLSPEDMAAFGKTYREQASAMRRWYAVKYAEIANVIERDV